MINDHLGDPTAFDAGAHNGHEFYSGEYYDVYNDSIYNQTGHNDNSSDNDDDYYTVYRQSISSAFTILVSIFGLLGNGMVIWLLGFRNKRNPFTTYILNLAIADLGVLAAAVMLQIVETLIIIGQVEVGESFLSLFYYIYFFLFSSSQYHLTVISMDRCVSVFFPIWHRCHRPRHLSGTVCALIWVASFLACASNFAMEMVAEEFFSVGMAYLWVVNAYLSLPLMTISSLMIFFKVCCKPKQPRRQKLLITILVTVCFFVLFCFPITSVLIERYLFKDDSLSLVLLFACLNSSVNPFLYYLFGRTKKGRSNKSMKAALQKLFKEE